MQAAGATAFAPSFEAAAAAPSQWLVVEGPNTPHINMGGGRDEAGMRRIKQLGVDYVTGGGVGGPLPWKESDIRAAIERCDPAAPPTTFIDRFKFYERAKSAWAVVMTGETAKYGNIIFKKGVTPIA